MTDLPSWLSAWSSVASSIIALLAFIISVVTIFVSKKASQEYALVSKDGKVLSHRGFKEYGLNVTLNYVSLDVGNGASQKYPEYHLSFAKLPDYFELTTRDGAVTTIEQSTPNSFKVQFTSVNYGAPWIECNFKIQAY